MIELKACNVKVANQEVAALVFFADEGHICLEFEHLDKSLHDFMRERRFRPLLLMEIRPIVQQIAHALNHLKAAGIVHADLKLENVMLVDQLREPFRVKLIDFGLAFEASAAKLGSNIQTRHYWSIRVSYPTPCSTMDVKLRYFSREPSTPLPPSGKSRHPRSITKRRGGSQWSTATKPVQQNPPSLAEGRKTGQPHHTDLHPSTTTTQTRGTEGSRKRKIEHEELPPHKKNVHTSSNSRHDHHYNHKTGPSGSSRAEGQALSGQKRKGDHDDVQPQKKTCLPSSSSMHDPWHTRHHLSARRTRHYEHHNHHNSVPSGCTQTDRQALTD